MDRRAFLADSAGAALSLVPLGSRLDKAPGRVGVADVPAVDQAVTTIYCHDHGSAALRRNASSALHTAYQWLQDGTYTEKTGKRLRSATGHLSIAAGWLSYDSGRSADARSLCGEALAAARIADDAGLGGRSGQSSTADDDHMQNQLGSSSTMQAENRERSGGHPSIAATRPSPPRRAPTDQATMRSTPAAPATSDGAR